MQKKILIIDDSLMDRRLLMSLLKKNEITLEVLQAGDGEEGLQVLSDNFQDIKLIFLDWQMPKMDGMEFMGAVTKTSAVKDIPIVMITASGTAADKAHAYDVNPKLAGYVVKPFQPKTVLETIEPLLA